MDPFHVFLVSDPSFQNGMLSLVLITEPLLWGWQPLFPVIFIFRLCLSVCCQGFHIIYFMERKYTLGANQFLVQTFNHLFEDAADLGTSPV
jgi:hypothetical protein